MLLAEGIEGLFRALGVELPTADRVFAARTVIVALAVGVGITLAAGLFPAIRATRVPPIAAVREGATLPKSRFAPFVPWIGGLVVVGALAVLARAMFTDELGTGDRLLSIAAGVLLLFLGVAMLSSHVVRPLAVISSPIGRWAAFVFTVLFWPFFLLPYWLLRYGAWGPGAARAASLAFVGGGAPQPAAPADRPRHVAATGADEVGAGVADGVPQRRPGSRGRSHRRRERPRNPSRTAATAAALMIGIALVSFIATLTNGMKASNREAIEEQIAADYVVTSLDGYTPFVAAAGDALAASPVPEVVTSVRSDAGLVDGVTTEVGGIEPDTIADAYVFDWREGDETRARHARHDEGGRQLELRGGSRHLASATCSRFARPPTESAKITVAGTFEPPPFYPLIESVNVSTELFDSLYDRPRNRWTWANVAGRAERGEPRADGGRRSPASPTPSSRPARSGSTARTRTSTSSSRSCTSCSRSPCSSASSG